MDEKTYPQPHRLKNAVVRKWASSWPNGTAIVGVAMIFASSNVHDFSLLSYSGLLQKYAEYVALLWVVLTRTVH